MKLPVKIIAGLKLAFAGCFLVIALCSFLSTNRSLGWLSYNDQVKAQNMNVSVQDLEDIIDAVYYFPIDSIALDTDQNNVYHFSTIAAEGDDIKLLPYSSVDAKRQILMQIVFKPEVNGVQLLAATNTTEYITEGTPAADGNPLSSIVELSVINASDITTDGDTYVVSALAKTPHYFATVSTNNGLEAQISFTNKLDLGSYINTNSIFILIDYNEKSARYAMNAINNLIMSGDITVAGDNIGFDCDFEFQVNPIQ